MSHAQVACCPNRSRERVAAKIHRFRRGLLPFVVRESDGYPQAFEVYRDVGGARRHHSRNSSGAGPRGRRSWAAVGRGGRGGLGDEGHMERTFPIWRRQVPSLRGWVGASGRGLQWRSRHAFSTRAIAARARARCSLAWRRRQRRGHRTHARLSTDGGAAPAAAAAGPGARSRRRAMRRAGAASASGAPAVNTRALGPAQ